MVMIRRKKKEVEKIIRGHQRSPGPVTCFRTSSGSLPTNLQEFPTRRSPHQVFWHTHTHTHPEKLQVLNPIYSWNSSFCILPSEFRRVMLVDREPFSENRQMSVDKEEATNLRYSTIFWNIEKRILLARLMNYKAQENPQNLIKKVSDTSNAKWGAHADKQYLKIKKI